ncbi:MAG: transglycosylase SLT domain-containing protein, partial [Arcobacteraceae bacterium]|nr:transglycosylase SLT domain-containing protein [Arcobacteraceae bacterium]
MMIMALAYQESGLDQSKRSSAGAIGVMQLLPDTATGHPIYIDNIEVLNNNARAGVKYLRWIFDEFYKDIEDEVYDLVISSSAMQWSKDLPLLVTRLSKITKQIDAVLFTSNTFKSIYKITNQKPSILSLEQIKEAFLQADKNTIFEVFNYKIEFDNKKELFKYIKNSGVKGDIKLSFKDAKALYKKYPLNYLEFEVVFCKN